LEQHHDQFQKDRTYILIQRLRHNVIKTGLRAISTSYSKISLKDAAAKLEIGGAEDAEFIVAKVYFVFIFSVSSHFGIVLHSGS